MSDRAQLRDAEALLDALVAGVPDALARVLGDLPLEVARALRQAVTEHACGRLAPAQLDAIGRGVAAHLQQTLRDRGGRAARALRAPLRPPVLRVLFRVYNAGLAAAQGPGACDAITRKTRTP